MACCGLNVDTVLRRQNDEIRSLSGSLRSSQQHCKKNSYIIVITPDYLLNAVNDCAQYLRNDGPSTVIDMDGRSLPGRPHLVHNNVQWQHSNSVETFELSTGAIKIMNVPNAGGSSVRSEILSFEIIRQLLHGVQLHKTEMEIAYFPRGSKKTDYAVTAQDGDQTIHLGVSVTRAMRYLENQIFDARDARHLLKKKLDGCTWSTRNNYCMNKNEQFKRQILHVFAQSADIAQLLEQEYSLLPDDIRSNTIVMITLTPETGSEWLYFE